MSNSAPASWSYALAAMALNFLLGYTGVLSFGHAAYFGLGAYGTAMTIKYLYPSTPVGMLVGMSVGTVAAAIIGPMIVRLRGVYFAMCTIAFGQVFYFICLPVDLGHRRRRRGQRLDRSRSISASRTSTSCKQQQGVLLFRAGGASRSAVGGDGVPAALAVRPHAAGDPRERAPRALSRHSGRPPHLDVLGHFLLLRQRRRRALRADERFHRSARDALGPVGQFRHHGRARRHALVLGAADRRGDYLVLQDYISSHTENWMSFIGLFFVLVVLFFPRGVLGIIRRKVIT